MALYYVAGRVVGHRVVLAVFWVASLVPLYFLSFFAMVAVTTFTQCSPGQSDCPV